MKIAVIGAGFSGLLAAYLLEKQGIDVTLYEKEDYLGGHCRTLVHKDLHIELGTVFSFCDDIKELLIELDVPFTERFNTRNFIDEHYNYVEQVPRDHISALLEQLHRLKDILASYPDAFHPAHYGTVHEDLTLSLEAFLDKQGLTILSQAIEPHLSSFGFGSIRDLPAFYAFSIFDSKTINTFVKNEKLLFVDHGFSEVIQRLSQQISDIRYASPVTRLTHHNDLIRVETPYTDELYNKVLVASKLPAQVFEDDFYRHVMACFKTSSFISIAYKVDTKNNMTTYYKSHLGQASKIQFFHTFKQNKKTVLVAYAYGDLNQTLINDITADIERIGIHMKHLIAVKQWQMFPHLASEHLTPDFYNLLISNSKQQPIQFMGSLISKPAISSLYTSVKHTVEQLLNAEL